MARSGVNKVILIGNLGQDPEVRYMPNGAAVANISVATTESWRDKSSGTQKDVTEWHRVVLYRRLAEIAGEYLRKGAKIYIEGRLHTRKWQDQSGQDRYTTEVQADEMQMLDSRGSGGAVAAEQTQNRVQQAGSARSSGVAAQKDGHEASEEDQPFDFDDSIPF